MDFGFDDGKVIKQTGIEKFVQNKNETHRVSVVSFKTFHESILADKTKEKGSALTDKEKAEFIDKIDKNLAEKLNKKPNELTDADRLNITKPKFSVAFTHFGDGVGFIRCLSEYSGTTLVKPEICCRQLEDADQTVAVAIMTYPVDEDFAVDVETFKRKKQINFYVWRLNWKKYKQVEVAYKTAREDKQEVIDLKVSLDGDAKYQKQMISKLASAYWAREDVDPEIRQWVLDQGLRARKYTPDHLGFAMKKENLIERLGGGSSQPKQEDAPQLQSYSALLND